MMLPQLLQKCLVGRNSQYMKVPYAISIWNRGIEKIRGIDLRYKNMKTMECKKGTLNGTT